MPLTADEIDRYKRHLVLKEVGGQGQQKLKDARVLIIGAGGLGAPAILYLAAAGVGTLAIIDDDTVSLDNLQRQVIYQTSDVGQPKVEATARHIEALNPTISVNPINARLTADNAMQIIADYDYVIDGSDNFATRYLVSDACYLAKKTLVYGAVGPFDGYVTIFKPHLTNADGNPYPSYRCLFPEAPPPGTVANCEEVGVLGAVVGVIATLQATETLKEIIGIGDSLAGRLLIYDAKSARFETVSVAWDPDNALTGTTATIKDLSAHAATAAET
jgi:molybdopterin-synthase adenylyltransferase